jgi:hypothetical protein
MPLSATPTSVALHIRSLLLEKVLVNFSDMHCVFDPAPDIMSNHQLGQLLAINENNALAEEARNRGRLPGGEVALKVAL